jgi:cysteinyl-tRNA synthetase
MAAHYPMSSLSPNFSQNNCSSFSNEKEILNLSIQFRHNVRQIALSLSSASPKESADKILRLCDDFRKDFRDVGIEIQDKSGKTSWQYNATRKD